MISNIETIAPKWNWNPERSETELLKDNLTIIDSGQGKAWTTAIGPDVSLFKQPNTFNYYEIKVEFCNTSNSIKIVFGLMSERYMNKILSINRGEIGSLRGSSPFGYFKEFGIGTICYFANGTISQDGLILTGQKAKPFTTNDRIGMLIDTNNSNVAFFKNGELQTTFINILNSFQPTSNTNNSSSGNNTPIKSFPIFPSISLIKQNSVTILQNPTIPQFIYDTNQLIQNLNNIDINSTNGGDTVTKTSTSTTTTSTSTSTPGASSPLSSTTTTTTTTSTTTTTNNNVNSPNTNNINSSNDNIKPNESATTEATATIINNNSNIPNNSNNSKANTQRIPINNTPNLLNTKELPDPNNNCPVCGISFKSIGKDWNSINKHIDECLTFNLLDKETDDPKRPETVKCPYCKKSIPSIEFIYHCNDKHLLENHHSHKCPLCSEKSTNLISHLSKSHIKVQQKQVGVGYSASTLENDLGDQECAICLEEFYKGQQVARLECWCIFHIDCILTYITKSKKCPVHN